MDERLKELAEQAGLSKEFSVSGLWLADDQELERFAELIRQDEREACAKFCDDQSFVEGKYAAAAIRARG